MQLFVVSYIEHIVVVDEHAAGTSELIPFRQVLTILGENLDALIGAVANQETTPAIDKQGMGHIKLRGAAALCAPLHQIASILIKLDDTVVPMAVSDKEIPIFCLGHIRRAIESIGASAGKATGTKAQQDIAVGIDLGNGMTALALKVGGPDVSIWRQTESMGQRHPLRAAE